MTTVLEERRIEDLLRSIQDLPTIPETLLRILETLEEKDSEVDKLADMIRVDPPLAARMLRLANSPYYDGGGDIVDLRDCVTLLGYKTVRELALCVMLADTLLKACREKAVSFDYRNLWRHSVHVALISQKLGVEVGEMDHKGLFTAGLLHDLGKFIAVLNVPEKYAGVLEIARMSGRRLIDVERETFGFDHARVGGAFARQWYFPESVAAVINAHHDDFTCQELKSTADRASVIVGLADNIACYLFPDCCDLSGSADDNEQGAMAKLLGLPEDIIDADVIPIIEVEEETRWLAG